MSVLSIDFETASVLDLRKTGVYPYARHPETRVLCMAYAFDEQDPKVWRWHDPFPKDVLEHVQLGRDVRAWNAGFEYQIWNHTLQPQIGFWPALHGLSLLQLHDTMADAAYFGLPLSLDQAAEAAHTGHKKDKEGHALMMRMNKPRSKDKQGNPTAWWHEDDPDKFDRLCEYCAQDVRVERDVKRAIGQDLPPKEREMWLLDQRINARGVALDVPLIERMQTVATEAKAAINDELSAGTGGEVKSVGSNAAMLSHLQAHGFPHDNLRADTVAGSLTALDEQSKDPAVWTWRHAQVRKVLELRAAGSKTSAAKLPAMLACAGLDDKLIQCVRGMLQYYGAFRTGRWAGRLIQPQNMPRPALKPDVILRAIHVVMNGADAATLELLFGVPAMEIISSLLRSVLVARVGRKLVVFDFSQIEARVLPWLAGEEKKLQIFRTGQDVYKHSASDIFGIPVPDIDGDQRQIGKVGELALGFGGGKGAFQTMAQNYGVTVTDKRAEEIKVAWRAANPKVVQMWWALDAAFKAACADTTGTFIQQVGQWLRVGRWGAHVVIVLPSGRGLFYRDAKLEANPDDPSRMDATYMGLNQYTRKWERLRTYGGKIAENVTQATARDCMAHVMLEADKQGIETLLTVHDELITEADNNRAEWQAKELEKLMSEPPAWAPGLPVEGDGWIGDRYRK